MTDATTEDRRLAEKFAKSIEGFRARGLPWEEAASTAERIFPERAAAGRISSGAPVSLRASEIVVSASSSS